MKFGILRIIFGVRFFVSVSVIKNLVVNVCVLFLRLLCFVMLSIVFMSLMRWLCMNFGLVLVSSMNNARVFCVDVLFWFFNVELIVLSIVGNKFWNFIWLFGFFNVLMNVYVVCNVVSCIFVFVDVKYAFSVACSVGICGINVLFM